jgi:hypothetical protein
MSFSQEIKKIEADVFDINNLSKVEFKLKMEQSFIEGQVNIDSKFTKDNLVALQETAKISSKTAEILEYKIKNNQTDESGTVTTENNQIKIEYTDKNKKMITKFFDKVPNLVAPANFEEWIKINFEKFKQNKSQTINFLVWDRHETFKFKITYLGQEKLNDKEAHLFKMNISNPLFAAFVSPIKVWFNNDMTAIVQYKGRMALKKQSNGKLEDLDAMVVYK